MSPDPKATTQKQIKMSPDPKATTQKQIKMSYYIPFEIQAEIMKRLPVKSFIRFESVCKAWKSYIHSSEFIADYKSCLHPQHCLLVTCLDYNYKDKYVSIVDDDTFFPLSKLSRTIPSSIDLLNTVATFGSSQGLFCFYGYMEGDLMAVIWNPLIRKSVNILVSSKSNCSVYQIVVGFGVYPRTFDPMLVKITYTKTFHPCYNDRITNHNPTQVDVFTLSSGAWKSRSINLPRESIQFTQDYCVDLDGFIYWLARDGSYNMIMSFDMTSENFIEISLPNGLAGTNAHHTAYRPLSIFKQMESLVVLEPNALAGARVYKVWRMEGGVHKSFIKIFTIGAPNESIRSVLGFRKSGEPIIGMADNGSDSDKLGVYEPNSRHISYIGISEQYSRLASSYTNTLLLLDR